MRAADILLEAGTLDAALRRGWVRIKYLKLNGTSRIMMATTSPDLYAYTYRSTTRKPNNPKNKLVWERNVGWRALRRNRISGWVEAGPVDMV